MKTGYLYSKFLYHQTYIQWIIREIVCPEIEWLKEKSYNEAYDQCTKAFKGLVNSLIASSAWKKPFKRALDNLPKFVLSDLPDSLKGVQCGKLLSFSYSYILLDTPLSDFIS